MADPAAPASPDGTLPAAAGPRQTRRSALMLLVLGVLALHGWLLGDMAGPRTMTTTAPATVPLRAVQALPAGTATVAATTMPVAGTVAEPVRTAARPAPTPLPAAARAASPSPAPSTETSPAPAPARSPARSPPPSVTRHLPATEPTSAPATGAQATEHPPGAGAGAGAGAGTDAEAEVGRIVAAALPHRQGATMPPLPPAPARAIAPPPTTPPPSAELSYAVRRGPVTGRGRLVWRVSPAGSGAGPDSYSLSLEARLPVLGVIFSETSSGGFDAHGLAPVRHTERRLRRSERALSITRGAGSGTGVLSFSASTARLALQPGTQDRVSWLVQLAAVYGATPAPTGGGQQDAGLPATLDVPVASVNGDLRLWQFHLQPPVPGAPGLLHLQRRPAPGEFDTTAEIWLDRARHAWPVRVLLTEAGGETMELRLEQLSE